MELGIVEVGLNSLLYFMSGSFSSQSNKAYSFLNKLYNKGNLVIFARNSKRLK